MLTDSQKKLIDKLYNILLDIDDHRSESYPDFMIELLKAFGVTNISLQQIEDYIQSKEE